MFSVLNFSVHADFHLVNSLVILSCCSFSLHANAVLQNSFGLVDQVVQFDVIMQEFEEEVIIRFRLVAIWSVFVGLQNLKNNS